MLSVVLIYPGGEIGFSMRIQNRFFKKIIEQFQVITKGSYNTWIIIIDMITYEDGLFFIISIMSIADWISII